MNDIKVEVPEGYKAVWNESETTVRVVKDAGKLKADDFWVEQRGRDIVVIGKSSRLGLLSISLDGTVCLHGSSISKKDGFNTNKSKLEVRA